MIKSVTVINYKDESIKLELGRPEKSGFAIRNISGLGPCKANISVTDISTDDGGLFSSARVEKRNIVMNLVYYGRLSAEEVRHLSYQYFPLKKNVTLVVETDARTCQISGYVESNEPDIFSERESAQISIICPDPYFYGMSAKNVTFAGKEPLFEFPFENNSLSNEEIEFGVLTNVQMQNILYEGDADVGFKVYIKPIASVRNITVYNVRTREEMSIDTDKIESITGEAFGVGDELIISTVKREKGAYLLREGRYYNVLNCVDIYSDWFVLTKGDNSFAFTAEEGPTNIELYFSYQLLYEGC